MNVPERQVYRGDSTIEAAYLDTGMAALSDVALTRAVGADVAVPRQDPADSFVLHAPLELAARAALLPWVDGEHRHLARLHLFAVGTQYRDFGPGIADPVEPPASSQADEFPGSVDPIAWLGDSLAAGDLDAVDLAAIRVAATATPAGLSGALGDVLLPLTGAAAHAPIFLHQFGRIGPRGELPAALFRPLARNLGQTPEHRLRWIDDWRPAGPTNVHALTESLRNAPTLGVPGSTFIHPLYMQVDESGAAAAELGSVVGNYSREAALGVLRTAATTMLVDAPEHAPYGWSHCLTIPQAVLGLAPSSDAPERVLAVAATGVLAFRAALGAGPLAEVDVGELPPVDPIRLATDAATRHDAHIVKYTLACLDAAADDPEFAKLYLNAADHLLRWWDHAGGDPTDPLH
ncbi:MAG: hypothetical protein ACR2QO_07560 [Acidimicrobiales bacterium]